MVNLGLSRPLRVSCLRSKIKANVAVRQIFRHNRLTTLPGSYDFDRHFEGRLLPRNLSAQSIRRESLVGAYAIKLSKRRSGLQVVKDAHSGQERRDNSIATPENKSKAQVERRRR